MKNKKWKWKQCAKVRKEFHGTRYIRIKVGSTCSSSRTDDIWWKIQ